MGDNGRPRIMQVAVFQPGSFPNNSPNVPPTQPAQQTQQSQQPQATSSQVVPVRQMQPQTTHSQQPQQFFQPIQPTPARLMVPNNSQGPSNGPPPPTLENLRLVGTAQYRQIVPNPNEPGQRLIPQYHKIVPRSGPVRYATIQPGQPPVLTMSRQIQPRPQTQNNGHSSTPAVFQAVPFTTQPNRDPIILSKHQFERFGKPITIQFNNNDGNDKPPVLQQEEPFKQNTQTSSEQGTSGTHSIVKLNLAKPAKSASASDLTLPPTELPPKSQPPKKRRTLPVEDDSLVIYPPPKPKNVTSKNFYSPEAYDLDQFLMEAVFKPEKEVLQHNFKGTSFTEYTKPPQGDEGVVTAEKIKSVSSLLGLKPVTPNKLNKKTNKRQHSSNKKEDHKKESKLTRGQEEYFEEFLERVTAKAKIAETKPSFCVKPRQKNSPKITGNNSPIALPETTATRSPIVATRTAPRTEPSPPNEVEIVQNEAVNNDVETSTSFTNQNDAVREEVEATQAETSITSVEAQITQPTTPKTPPSVAAGVATTPVDQKLQKIAEECVLEVAGCSLQQLPGGLPLKRLSLWTVDECQKWTQQVTNSDEYRHIFEREEIDGSVMVFVPYNELAALLNLRFGPAKKMEIALKVVKAFDAKVRDL